MWSKGFFIGGFRSGDGSSGNSGLINVDGNDITVNMPLDLYIDDDNNVFAGNNNNNSILIYVNENEIYTRKVV